MTYRLIDTRDDSVVKEWGALPKRMHIPGVFSISPVSVGDRQGDYLIVEVQRSKPAITKFHTKTGESEARSGNVVTITETYSAPSVQQAKNRLGRQINRSARDRLSETDWRVLRGVEDGANPVPPAVRTQRAALRAHSDALEAQVNALSTLAELDAWQEAGWPD